MFKIWTKHYLFQKADMQIMSHRGMLQHTKTILNLSWASTINFYYKLFQRKCITNKSNHVDSLLEDPAYNPYLWQELPCCIYTDFVFMMRLLSNVSKVQVYLHLKPDTCSLQHPKGKTLQNWGKALQESAKCIILKSASYTLLLLQMHTAESALYHTAWHAAYLCFLKAFCFTAAVHKVNHKSALLCSGGENKRGKTRRDLNGKM